MSAIEMQDSAALERDDRLIGRVALVTGGTRGIGAAISRALAARGAVVAAGFGSDRERAARFEAESAISVHQGDVGSPEACRRTVQEVIERYGRLDILVNNAGITADRTALKMSDDDWHRVLAVNLSGAFFTAQAALGHMIERGSGRIVNISSIIGQTGNIGQANYAASKAGLLGLTMSLAKEAAFALKRQDRLEPDGLNITVNAVAPGFIETDMLASVPEKVLDGIRSQVPLSRLGRADEIARVVEFLAADASSYITGQVWAVNGGMDM
ncbi:3-oxoacyl-ACP reductase FabG [Solirubrobacter ginsenosidimutans]|uniref:3-oxoacyl-ACP reductase FabG n=1 Tax=Solirubrobacter ginsenosidimutans TaxID=490573 RepID=A0A9X3N1L3_9ACTN|nr:3-oxoacyl-ACP reductase FabG [Solirubrobacter ginsenosidimutans]MDA0165641.1 3-oxoacyl-ACP reductase FabG [Solirubrobacter ginsenosidimutans]